MLQLFLVQRLIGLVMTVVIGAAAWFLFGKDILDDLKEDTARQEGRGPRSERIYQRSQFGPALRELKAEVGRNARLYEVSLRADRLEFQVKSGGGVAVYVSDDGDYDDLERDPNAVVTATDTFSIPASGRVRRSESSGRSSAKERGEFLTTQLRLMRDARTARLDGPRPGRPARCRLLRTPQRPPRRHGRGAFLALITAAARGTRCVGAASGPGCRRSRAARYPRSAFPCRSPVRSARCGTSRARRSPPRAPRIGEAADRPRRSPCPRAAG